METDALIPISHKRDVLRVTLNYKDINGLFSLPNVSPFSDDFQMYSATSGIEFIVNEMRANGRLRRVETTILLPVEKITHDLERQTLAAVRRYCLARIHTVGQDQRILRTRIFRSIALAIVGLFVSVGIGYPLSIDPDFVTSLIGNILYFFGWVAIWYPMDAIVFGRRDLRMDENSYQRVMDMQLSIRPAAQ